MAFEKTVEAARGKWRGILLHFGIDEKYLRDLHGPCPLCGGHDRYRWDDKDGSGSFYCSTCGPGSGMRLLMEHLHLPFPEAAKRVDGMLGLVHRDEKKAEKTEEDKRAYMKSLFKGSRPVAPGDPVSLYLERRCGDCSGQLSDIRFHPALKHSVSGTTHPAMLAMMGWDGKKFSGIHRTYLTADGFKAAVDPVRMNYGDAGPVRLGEAQERLGIAEGLETALCASHLFSLPVWSGICADGVLKWVPPAGVTSVVIFGDNDANFVGQAAAYDLAKILRGKGLAVEIKIPPVEGQDWADVWASGPEIGVA